MSYEIYVIVHKVLLEHNHGLWLLSHHKTWVTRVVAMESLKYLLYSPLQKNFADSWPSWLHMGCPFSFPCEIIYLDNTYMNTAFTELKNHDWFLRDESFLLLWLSNHRLWRPNSLGLSIKLGISDQVWNVVFPILTILLNSVFRYPKYLYQLYDRKTCNWSIFIV